MMTLSSNGREAIIRREGLRLTAYTCEAGFARDIAPIEKYLNSLAYPFTQSQYDALVSFILNIGLPRFKMSTMLQYIKALAAPERVAGEFIRWIWVTKIKREKLKNGTVQETKVKVQSKGLITRRESERRQFLSGGV